MGLVNYDKSILSLSNSILKYYNADNTHNTLDILDRLLAKDYKNVVLFVCDGMGSKNLEEILPKDSFFREHMEDELDSVYPPTTTAATTTLLSGLSPAEHGWLGWSLFFDEMKENVNLYPNTNYDGDEVADYNVALKYIPFENIIEKINKTGKAHAESVSPFGTCEIEKFSDILPNITKICKNKDKNFIYTYWIDPDHLMHRNGVKSQAVCEAVKQIQREIERLSVILSDTLIIVTADHGHIDTKKLYLGDYSNIMEMLEVLPSFDCRTISFRVKKEKHKEFEKEFEKEFGTYYNLFNKQDVIDKKIFGDGDINSRFESFLGDYIAVAVSDTSLFYNKYEYDNFCGVHAGSTVKEIKVPFIVIECK